MKINVTSSYFSQFLPIQVFKNFDKGCFLPFPFLIAIYLVMLLSSSNVSAQFTDSFPLTKTAAPIVSGADAAKIVAGSMIPGTNFALNASPFNSSGYACKIPTTYAFWPATLDDKNVLDFPISGAPDIDITITRVSFMPKRSNSSGEALFALAYEADGNGVWNTVATTPASQTTANSNAFFSLNLLLTAGRTYKLRMFVYAETANVTKNNRIVYVKDFVINGTTAISGTPPTVNTTTIAGITKYTATGNGSISGGTQTVLESGFCWGLAANPDIISNSKTGTGPSGVTSGSISVGLSGLNSATLYHARAYATTLSGTYYGSDVTFTTASPTAPSGVQTTINVVYSIKALVDASVSDSGGTSITSKGICWNTNTNPTLANFSTSEGQGAAGFTSILANLTPKTTYYARAYYTNNLGTTYGNEIQFLTKDSAASIYSNQTVLNFGNLFYKAPEKVLSYKLYARKLTPASDTITITAPSGFKISLNATNGFSTSLKIPYANGFLSDTIIYVVMNTGAYGIYTNGSIITHSGGGAGTDDIINVKVVGSVLSSPDDKSNQGTDFWTGYGYITEMSDVNKNSTSMSVYIAASEQDAEVMVDIPGIPSWTPQVVTVQAHTIKEISGFPFGDGKTNPANLDDSRLYYTGVSNRAVHVQSTNGVPISVWTYTSAKDNSAAGCMNFPTNTWNSTYTVQAFGSPSNSNNPNSFFFVIAKDDNTKITFTPSADIVDSSSATIFKDALSTANVLYKKDSTYTITLQKGQLFNAMSFIAKSNNAINSMYDLSGTKISTDCSKKIAVFGGNGRCLVDTSTANPQFVGASSGSDNMLQQMFPNVAWGTTYLAVPTKTMEDNYYRIFVQDTATVVTVNDFVLDKSTLVNNLYYQISGSGLNYVQPYDTAKNHYYKIKANKAISVTQFIVATAIAADKNAAAAGIGNNGKGDPEMIILSSVEQSINTATVATPNFKNNLFGGNYINVVIPKAGVASFKIFSDTTRQKAADVAATNGLPINKVFTYDAEYRLFSDTNIILVDTGATSYVNGMAYLSDTSLIPLTAAFQPFPSDTNYYFAKFKLIGINPNTLEKASYTMTSSVPFNAVAYGMNAGESYGFNAGTNLKALSTIIDPIIKNPYSIKQSATNGQLSTCLKIPFTFSMALTFRADSIRWNINGAVLSPSNAVLQRNPIPDSIVLKGKDSLFYYTLTNTSNVPIPYQFSSVGTFQAAAITAFSNKLTLIGADPCAVASDSIQFPPFSVNVLSGINPNFSTNYIACAKDSTILFKDQSIDAGGFKISQWKWDFGFAGKKDSVQNPSVRYPVSGTYNVQLRAIDTLGCYADTVIKLKIQYNSDAKFSASALTVCSGATVSFTDQSATYEIGGTITKWNWDLGDGRKPTTANPANIYQIVGKDSTFTIRLTVENNAGCISSPVTLKVLVHPAPIANFKTDLSQLDSACINGVVNITATPQVNGGGAIVPQYVWNTGVPKSDTTSGVNYSTAFTATGSYTVRLAVTDVNGCKDDTTKKITVLGPLAAFTVATDTVNYNYMRFVWSPVAGATSYACSLDGGVTYFTPSSGVNGTSHAIVGVQPTNTITLIVKAFGILPCQTDSAIGVGTYKVPELFVPTVFSPNGLGNPDNEKLKIPFVTRKSIKTFDIKIFNQWGQMIFHSTDPAFEWDGTVGGKAQPTGVYIYVVQASEQNGNAFTKKGTLSLIR